MRPKINIQEIEELDPNDPDLEEKVGALVEFYLYEWEEKNIMFLICEGLCLTNHIPHALALYQVYEKRAAQFHSNERTKHCTTYYRAIF
ncbi:MAG: hypothetical protein FWC53_01310 [Firmicutes bacterium]|nr:hypothetical protein [Bacillota bacterium]